MSGDQANRAADGAMSPIDLLEMAARFRQMARLFRGDPLEEHLKKLAEELEDRAQHFTKRREAGTNLTEGASHDD